MSHVKNTSGMHFSILLNTIDYCTAIPPSFMIFVEVFAAPVEALWKLNAPFDHFQTVDVTLRMAASDVHYQQHAALSGTTPEDKAHRFLANCMQRGVKSPRHIKFIIPTVDGFLGRRNFFERRLLDCPLAEEIVGFLDLERKAGPTKLLSPVSDGFISVLSSAAAGILLHSSTSAPEIDALASLEKELEARLAYRWLLPSPSPQRNVVLVEGYPHLQMGEPQNDSNNACHLTTSRRWLHPGGQGS